MNEQNNNSNGVDKKTGYIVGGIIVIAVAAYFIYANMNKSSSTLQSSQNPAANNSTTTPPAATPSPMPSKAPSKTLSYGDAIKAYPNRFQFSQCQATPQSIAVKKASVVMLDNRDAGSHTISADGQTFKIPGYGYVLVHTAVIGNLPVTCDGANRAMLNVQK